MVSCDIFQHRMSSIFQTFTDVLVFMDNILLFTKKIFDHHLQRLTTVLQTLKENNLHVHIEDTFLASQRVDYLGYTLTPTGVEPQQQKILPILRFKEPANIRQLRSFLGFVNYYKKIWPHHSHTLEPATSLTKKNVKFVWGPAQTTAFATIKIL